MFVIILLLLFLVFLLLCLPLLLFLLFLFLFSSKTKSYYVSQDGLKNSHFNLPNSAVAAMKFLTVS